MTLSGSRRTILLVLLSASVVSVASTDLFVPSLPDLPAWFGTSEAKVKLSVSLNVLVFGLAQLLHGPLADRFGRRPVLFLSMALFSLASLVCWQAQSIGVLLAGRMLQGLFAAAEAVVVLAVIREAFDPQERVQVLALFGMAIAGAPAVAPIIGGYLHSWFGWQANFLAMSALAAAVTLLIYRYLPESGMRDRRALVPRRVFGAYFGLLRDGVFMGYSAMSGLCMGVIFAFVTAAPFILVDLFGIPIKHYAYFQAAQVLAFFLGSWAANRLVGAWGSERLLQAALACGVLGAVALLALAGSAWLGPLSLTCTVGLMFFAVGPVFAITPARAMESTSQAGGVAAAVLSAMEMLMAALGSVLVTAMGRGSAMPLAVTLALLVGLQCLLYLATRRAVHGSLPGRR